MGLHNYFSRIIRPDTRDRIQAFVDSYPLSDGDPFGLDIESLKHMLALASFLYRRYFRCETTGVGNIPDGPVILASNHGGQLPFDAMMISTGIFLESDPPRIARGLMDKFVPSLPVISNWFSKLGVVLGTPENARLLLQRGELLLTFPEGIKAIQKPLSSAYRLLPFGNGFIRLALACDVPVVPVSVVGPEEQYPTLYTLERGSHLLNTPSIPLWLHMPVPLLGLLPLPVKYHLEFGEPIRFKGDPDDDDDVISEMADQVRTTIQTTLGEMRAARKGIF